MFDPDPSEDEYIDEATHLGWMDDRNPLDEDEMGFQGDPLASARGAGERPTTPLANDIRP